jgi:hypothetical protein
LEINKTLAVIEADGHNAVVKSPASLALDFTTSPYQNKPVIYVHDADGVTLRGLTVDGDGQGNSNNRFVGIAYHNAGGMILRGPGAATRQNQSNQSGGKHDDGGQLHRDAIAIGNRKDQEARHGHDKKPDERKETQHEGTTPFTSKALRRGRLGFKRRRGLIEKRLQLALDRFHHGRLVFVSQRRSAEGCLGLASVGTQIVNDLSDQSSSSILR